MMRKRTISTTQEPTTAHDERWIDMETAAVVEVSSEEKDFPIESALVPGETKSWRAAKPGIQTVRVMFDQPQKLRRIVLVFEESDIQRTQEFVLRWSPDGGHSFQEIVRQRWNFSPPGSVRELEDYRVELTGATVLELIITPEISGGTARASLKSFRVA
jgi:hypothetical protein